VKNLKAKTNVAKNELDKFIRDLDSNPDIFFGILVNLEGGFPVKNEAFKFHLRFEKINNMFNLIYPILIN
jgi:hypothetical protein